MDPKVVGTKRQHRKSTKKLAVAIGRKTRRSKKNRRSPKGLKPLYRTLIERVEGICAWAGTVAEALRKTCRGADPLRAAMAEALADELEHYQALGARVIGQTRRRVLDGEAVPNDEKLFSIFEPHTELVVRGKAGKDVEFGHMIQIQQVAEKFITDYEVFEKKPVEPTLIDPALGSHRALFGTSPKRLAADKGYYQSTELLERLRKEVATVSIGKKGRRTAKETKTEQEPAFRHMQKFRAGVEGTISFLKRVFRLARCLNRGWEHFVSTVGAAVFSHNLVVLARC